MGIYNACSGMNRAYGTLLLTVAVHGYVAMAQTTVLKPGRVEGNVTNSVTGAGVKKAEIAMNGGAGSARGATTDATGHFAIENVQPGKYWIQLSCPGYAFPPGASQQKPVSVAEDQEVKDIALKLMPLGVISGRVRDEDGEPMIHVQIRGMRYVYINGRRQLNQTAFSNTNDLGEFRMIDVQPGKYLLEALPQPMGRGVAQSAITDFGNQIYPPTFYPGGIDLNQATSQEVKAGEEVNGVEFRLKKMASFHARGRVIDVQEPSQDEERGIRTIVQVLRTGRVSNMARAVQQDGSFDIPDLVPGEYTLMAFRNDGQTQVAGHYLLSVSARDVDDITITMESGVSIRGSITVEGTPTAGQLSGIRVSLEPSDSSAPGIGMNGGLPGGVKDDGSFELRDVTPAAYVVNVGGAVAGKYLKSVKFNGEERADGIIDLTHQHGGELQLVFGGDPGQIHGTTTASAFITALPVVDGLIRRDQFRTTMSDQNGNFQLLNLAPGKYSVSAWESQDLSVVQIPEIRQQLEGKAAKVTLGANGNESVQVTVIPSADLEEALRKLP